MNIGEAYAIFKQIDSEKFTTLQKLNAIKTVIFEADTINGITKDELRNALRWVWDLLPGQGKWYIGRFDLRDGQSYTLDQCISSPRPAEEIVCANCISFVPRKGLDYCRCTNPLGVFKYTTSLLNCDYFEQKEQS